MIKIAIVPDDKMPLYRIQPKFINKDEDCLDHYFIDLSNGKTFKGIFYVSMHMGEHSTSLEILKFRLWCERHNYALCFYGSVNSIPLLSQFADMLLLTTCPTVIDLMYGQQTCYIWPHNFWTNFINPYFHRLDTLQAKYVDAGLPPLFVMADAEITEEEVVERFRDVTILVRKTTFDLYQSLKQEGFIKPNQIVTEFHWVDKPQPWYVKLEKGTKDCNVELAAHDFNSQLFQRCHLHYMGVQVLSCLLSNWMYCCLYGAAELFTLLPVKNFYAESQGFPRDLVRKLSVARFGELGGTFPIYEPTVGLGNFPKVYEAFKRFQELEWPCEIVYDYPMRTEMTTEEQRYFKVKETKSPIIEGS